MLKRFILALLVCMSRESFSTSAELRDDAIGYTVALPELGLPSAGEMMQALMWFGPAKDGFSPNVNLQVQQIQTDRDKYIAQSEIGERQLSMTIIARTNRDVAGNPAVMTEAEWSMQGKKLRFISLAVIQPKRVLLLTCTAAANDFENHAEKFRKAIDSFTPTK